MPDKHEVGGSSPLGPTKEIKQQIPIILHFALCILHLIWGCSSAGRAPALQAGGHGFESHHLHQEAQKSFKMFIENRINKRNETDSCILRKTCYWDIFSKRFFRTKEVGKNNFVNSDSKMSGRTNQWIIKPKRSFNLQPKKTIICEAQAKKAEKSQKELILIGEQKAVQAKKSVRWMPWHWEPKKDAITCDKLR